MLLTALGLGGLGGVVLQMSVATTPADSKLLRDARAEQLRFETTRRMHLPRDRMGGGSRGGRHCDAIIGRYCYWYDSTVTTPAPEPRKISEARGRLLGFLDSAAARHPSDGWIAGQRTRYLIEADRPNEAVAAARECRADRWWCASLEALALHAAQQYASSDSVFTFALREMPASLRCEWVDLRLLVGDRLSREISRATCDERARLADLLWTLSQPLWSTKGNDLRTEHFARVTMAHIFARTANAYGMAFGDDSREIMVRYGWKEWYTRDDPTPGLSMSPSIIGHDREPGYAFLPNVASLKTVPRLTDASWGLRNPTARTRYSPRHVKGAIALPHQLIRLPRGDSMRVGVAFRISDTALARDSKSAHLGVYVGSEVRIVGGRIAQQDGRAATLWMTVPRDTMVVSIEARGDSTMRMARARYTIDPLSCCVDGGASDLLLFDATGAEASNPSVEDAFSRALTSHTFSVRRPLGVHWEMERGGGGDIPAAGVWYSLTVTPLRTSIARRIATRLHLAPELAPVRLRWQATVQNPREAQSVTLRLPPNARGKYRVVLTVEPLGAAPITAMREIELVP